MAGIFLVAEVMQRGREDSLGHPQLDGIGGPCHQAGEAPGIFERSAKFPIVELIDAQTPEGAPLVARIVEPFRELEAWPSTRGPPPERDRPRTSATSHAPHKAAFEPARSRPPRLRGRRVPARPARRTRQTATTGPIAAPRQRSTPRRSAACRRRKMPSRGQRAHFPGADRISPATPPAAATRSRPRPARTRRNNVRRDGGQLVQIRRCSAICRERTAALFRAGNITGFRHADRRRAAIFRRDWQRGRRPRRRRGQQWRRRRPRPQA